MVPNIPGIPGPPLGGSSSGSSSPSGYNPHAETKMVRASFFSFFASLWIFLQNAQMNSFLYYCSYVESLNPAHHMGDSFHNKQALAVKTKQSLFQIHY